MKRATRLAIGKYTKLPAVHCFVIPLLRYLLYFLSPPPLHPRPRDLGVAIRETHAAPLITKPFDTPPASLSRRYMHAARARREFASVI